MGELATAATPTRNNRPLRLADFETLWEALDYAAQGCTGYNFFDGQCRLQAALPYAELRRQALRIGRRLRSLGLQRGDRVALMAETGPEFMAFFYGCQYGGYVPVPLPVTVNLGSRNSYVERLRRLLQSCRATAAMAPAQTLPFLHAAAQGLDLRLAGSPHDFEALPEHEAALEPARPDEVAYLQYTSGSTRAPRGVVITQRAVMANLAGIVRTGLAVRSGDRCVSWLPFYHDMGLVGFVLGPMVSQLSVDYLDTRDFAMRPRQWLTLLTRKRATISFAPPFGYDICARRIRPEEVERFDLSAWRVAGVGAETIQPERLERFAELLAPAGFDARAFLPCYGLAESSLAVTFATLDEGIRVDRVDGEALASRSVAVPLDAAHTTDSLVNTFVNCGHPLPGHEVVIRDADGRPLPDRHLGRVTVRGPSLMSAYFDDPDSTADVVHEEGWLDTGDLGFRTRDGLFITGRSKDLIIVHGRNIWPQDLERLAEEQPEVRVGDVSAFAATDPEGVKRVIMLVQCRLTEETERADLVKHLQRQIHAEFGINCRVDLVPPRTLPRTSSGKLSRAQARLDFIRRVGWTHQRGEAPPQSRSAAAGG